MSIFTEDGDNATKIDNTLLKKMPLNDWPIKKAIVRNFQVLARQYNASLPYQRQICPRRESLR